MEVLHKFTKEFTDLWSRTEEQIEKQGLLIYD
jgi:hypothetical protein